MSRELFERYVIESLTRSHERKEFQCGVPELDRYLQRQAGQDARRSVSSVFVLLEGESGQIHGYYTLSMAAALLDELPHSTARKLPRYPSVPAVRLGRLAVHQEAQGRGLGAHLLMDAMFRGLRSEVAWALFLVDATNEEATAFYRHFGFLSFKDEPRKLYLPRKTLEPLFAQGDGAS